MQSGCESTKLRGSALGLAPSLKAIPRLVHPAGSFTSSQGGATTAWLGGPCRSKRRSRPKTCNVRCDPGKTVSKLSDIHRFHHVNQPTAFHEIALPGTSQFRLPFPLAFPSSHLRPFSLFGPNSRVWDRMTLHVGMVLRKLKLKLEPGRKCNRSFRRVAPQNLKSGE